MTARKLQSRARSGQAWTAAEVFVFDVEGTLVDAMMPTLRCWRETLAQFGHDFSLAELHRLAGMDGDDMLALLLPDVAKSVRKEIVEQEGKRFRDEYLAHIPALPGVRPLFEQLKRSGRWIALATDCQTEQLRHYLDVCAIEDLVDAISCGDDIKQGKPAPDVVDIALRRVRAGRKPCVMVGDTPYDAQAALKAGVIPVGVLTGHFAAGELHEAGCRAVLRDPVALREALPHAQPMEASVA